MAKQNGFKTDGDLSGCEYFSDAGVNDFKKAVKIAEKQNKKLSDIEKNKRRGRCC